MKHDRKVIRMVDSGIFRAAKQRGDYATLFSTYEQMGADFGIMIDFVKT